MTTQNFCPQFRDVFDGLQRKIKDYDFDRLINAYGKTLEDHGLSNALSDINQQTQELTSHFTQEAQQLIDTWHQRIFSAASSCKRSTKSTFRRSKTRGQRSYYS